MMTCTQPNDVERIGIVRMMTFDSTPAIPIGSFARIGDDQKAGFYGLFCNASSAHLVLILFAVFFAVLNSLLMVCDSPLSILFKYLFAVLFVVFASVLTSLFVVLAVTFLVGLLYAVGVSFNITVPDFPMFFWIQLAINLFVFFVGLAVAFFADRSLLTKFIRKFWGVAFSTRFHLSPHSGRPSQDAELGGKASQERPNTKISIWPPSLQGS